MYNPTLKVGGVVLVNRAPGNRRYLPASIRAQINALNPAGCSRRRYDLTSNSP